MLIFSKFSFRFPEESFYSKSKASQNGSGKDEDPGNASGKTVKKKSVQDLPQGLDTLGKSACIGGNLSHHISRSQSLDKRGGKNGKTTGSQLEQHRKQHQSSISDIRIP